MENTYWNSKGKHQAIAEQLEKLIPVMGAVEKPRSTNRHLERLRKAINCYYDLYNNGLWNRKAEFSRLFGFSSSDYHLGRGEYRQALYPRVELAMDQFILQAALEQNLITEEDNH